MTTACLPKITSIEITSDSNSSRSGLFVIFSEYLLEVDRTIKIKIKHVIAGKSGSTKDIRIMGNHMFMWFTTRNDAEQAKTRVEVLYAKEKTKSAKEKARLLKELQK